ncbi:hypothetical protein QPK87_30215 [Kamptonema cortianum]|nr:hypothetical protein [Kamptonema cortianum]
MLITLFLLMVGVPPLLAQDHGIDWTGSFPVKTHVKPFKGVNPADTDQVVTCYYRLPKDYQPGGKEKRRVFVYMIWNPKDWVEWSDNRGHVLLYLPFKNEMAAWYDSGYEKIIEKAVQELSKKVRIAPEQAFIYGESRAASLVIRYATLKPDKTAAWAAGVTTLFHPEPHMRMRAVPGLLLQSEADDGLFQAAQTYYVKCRDMKLPVIWRSYPNIGHEVKEEGIALAQAFFDYYHEATRQWLDAKYPPTPGQKAQVIPAAIAIGDAQSFVHYSPDDPKVRDIPKEWRVELPDATIADKWEDKDEIRLEALTIQ